MEQEPLQHAEDWAVEIFGAAELGDPRRTDRLIKMASAPPSQSIGLLASRAGNLGGNERGVSFSE